MSEVYFTADTHFGHAGILRFCNRPFATIEEHDRALVDAWNATVRQRDIVYVLGDFAHRAGAEHAERTFRRLHGSKFLVVGNHDGAAVRRLRWAGEPRDRVEVAADGTRFVLDHYPLREWNAMRHGSVHLHGHVHGKLRGLGLSMDVGVDPNGYRPLHAGEVLAAVRRNQTYEP